LRYSIKLTKTTMHKLILLLALTAFASCSTAQKQTTNATQPTALKSQRPTFQKPRLGAWNPIETNKDCARFTSAGGTDTIRVTNYERWWINGADVGDTYFHSPKGSDNTADYYLTMTADGFTLQVPKNQRNILIISAPEARKTRHEIIVTMQSGNAFKKIEITQNVPVE